MKHIDKLLALLVVVITLFYACSSQTEGSEAKFEQPVKEAVKLPAFALEDAKGNIVDLSSFKGRKVFVNLWASWCPPCRAEIPSIEILASKIDKEKAVFIMLSLDKSFDDAKNFSARQNMTLPVYYPAENLPALFDTETIPATFIFDEKGDLLLQQLGSDDYSTRAYIDLLKRN